MLMMRKKQCRQHWRAQQIARQR